MAQLFSASVKRKQREVRVRQAPKGEARRETAPVLSFGALGLDEWLCVTCTSLGLHVPTPVQQACIPAVLSGRNIVACARTGTGKTAAFALPLLQGLSRDPYGVYAVVLTPARELAHQVADQLHALGSGMSVKVETVTGGEDWTAQSVALARRPHFVVATPGRFAEHLARDAENAAVMFSNVAVLVLDEADRVLDISMAPDLDVILSTLPRRRQTMLFSATITPDLTRIRAVALEAPFTFSETPEPATVAVLRQEYLFIPAQVKTAYLAHVMSRFAPLPLLRSGGGDDDDNDGGGGASDSGSDGRRRRRGRKVSGDGKLRGQEAKTKTDRRASSVIVFTSTCHEAQLIAEVLTELGILCVALHSKMPQDRRLASLGKFKSGYVRVLVATDVASRGLDIPEVELVVNFDVPRAPVDYIHRVGRTARAGHGGRAVTFVTQYDIDLLHAIEAAVGFTMVAMEDVQESDVVRSLSKVSTAQRVAKVRLVESGFIERLKELKKRDKRARKRQRLYADAEAEADSRREPVAAAPERAEAAVEQ